MFLTLILYTIIIFILIFVILNHVKFKRQNDYLRYVNKRLILKLEHEKKKNNTQIIPTVQAIRTPHQDKRHIKNVLTQSFNQLIHSGDITSFKVLSTNQIAKRNLFYKDLSLIDFVVLSNLGLFLVKLTHFKTKTFMHFNGANQPSLPFPDQFAHHISQMYHQQFHPDSNVPYTFSEKITSDKVIYQFYKYDPLKSVESSERNLSHDIEKHVNINVSTLSCIFDTNQTIYENQQSQYRKVALIKNEQALTTYIHTFAKTSHSYLTDDTLTQLETLFTQKH